MVVLEPATLRHQLQSDSSAVAGKSRSSLSEDSRTEELKVLTVSSTHSDKTEARVSSSAHESRYVMSKCLSAEYIKTRMCWVFFVVVFVFFSFLAYMPDSANYNLYYICFVIRRGTLEKSSSRLTSTVKPLIEPLPSEAVIDIKPEMDDDLIAEAPVEIGTNHGRTRNTASRPTAEIYRAGQSRFTSVSSADTCRPTEGSSHTRQQDGRGSRTTRTGSSKVL